MEKVELTCNSTDSAKVDLERLSNLQKDFRRIALSSLTYSGIEIRIDEKLEGKKYYLAVSPETYTQLKEFKAKIP